MSDKFAWKYEDRRKAQMIFDGVYLGPYESAKDLEFLKNSGISHILIVAGLQETKFLKPKFPEFFIYEGLVIEETPFIQLIGMIDKALEWMDNVIRSGGKILIHGNAGLNRSAAFVMSYLITKKSWKFQDAYNLVLEKRPVICLTEQMKFQLKNLEIFMQTIPTNQIHHPQILKRKEPFEEREDFHIQASHY
jgi:serine/threonine/tyrosine-interacting protein